MIQTPEPRSAGTLETRRVKQPWPKDKPFKILSIDGGGIRGILPASILAELEDNFLNGEAITKHFDMIAGTSTGGIIALGLSKGLSGAEIRDFYLEKGEKIFPRINKCFKFFKRLFKPIYDAKSLTNELTAVFKNSTLNEAIVRLCIPAFEGEHGEPFIYKTAHHPDYKNDKSEAMLNVALATTAAPTYFPIFKNAGYVLVDGGLVANNPIMVAVVDALTCFEIERSQIFVLSLGCGDTKLKVDKTMFFGGLFKWSNALKIMMQAQSHNSVGQTYLLLGKNQVIRVDASNMISQIELDDYMRASQELPIIAGSLVKMYGYKIQDMFLKS